MVHFPYAKENVQKCSVTQIFEKFFSFSRKLVLDVKTQYL